MGSIWTVYSILLELCCKNDYKLLISQMAVEFEDQKQSLKDIIERNNDMFMERESDLKDQFKDVQREHAELLEEKVYYKKYTDKLNEIIDDLRGKIEEETQIRKVFENKLNDLHSIVRDKEAGYKRAWIDLDHVLQDNIDKNKQLEELQYEYKDVTKIKNAFQIKFDTINQLLNQTQKEFQEEKAQRSKEVTRLTIDLEQTKEKLKQSNYKVNGITAELNGNPYNWLNM